MNSKWNYRKYFQLNQTITELKIKYLNIDVQEFQLKFGDAHQGKLLTFTGSDKLVTYS